MLHPVVVRRFFRQSGVGCLNRRGLWLFPHSGGYRRRGRFIRAGIDPVQTGRGILQKALKEREQFAQAGAKLRLQVRGLIPALLCCFTVFRRHSFPPLLPGQRDWPHCVNIP